MTMRYGTTSTDTVSGARPGGAAIGLRGVTKRFGDRAAVAGIDLDVAPGEFMTLLGPSGSGKTTTLDMIAGFTPPSSGEIRIDDASVTRVPPHRRDIGMVFQNYALLPHRTAAENIAYPLQRRRVPRAEQRRRVAEALGMVRMDEYGDSLPAELSGGQQQRVALARALVYRPRVLLMDEPLGALDTKLREWLQTEISRIHREVGCTVVYVTHDQEEALGLSDRIAVFNEGRIEQFGTAQELYEAPGSLFVGSFIGESTVLTGRGSAAGRGQTTIDVAGHRIVANGGIDFSDAALLIRPEKLRLEPISHARTGTENAIPVTIVSTTYLGASRRCTVSLPDGGEGVVRTAPGVDPWRPGDQVAMVWGIADGVLLDGASDSGALAA